MSVKSLEGRGGHGDVVRQGYLRKLKTLRKKYFVLRSDAAESAARLEYYDSEKKFAGGAPPKRSIPLKNCFNINRRFDLKHKHAIALYTKDDCFCVVVDGEEEAEAWLKALLNLQQGGEEAVDGETLKPTFEHVWQVTVLNRGLGASGLTGIYRLCLTDKTLSLIKRDSEIPQIELNLTNIRSCGNLKAYFFLEIGRSSTLGAGELWMETEDHNIAHNVHSIVFHAMSANSNREELGPKSRNRSSSATESSKSSIGRKPVGPSVPKPNLLTQGVGRERCDSMPSRARTTSEGNHVTSWNHQRYHLNSYRPASLYGRDMSHSPPSGSPVSPPSVGCSTDSAGSSYSLADETDCCQDHETAILGRYGHSLTPDEAIAEEDCLYTPTDVTCQTAASDDGYVDMSPRGRHHHSPTASLSSVTSGTPSTDMRFAEYPLEKVASYFGPTASEDEDARPARAYSVGSRPETYRYRKCTELATSADSRVRAFSVGSKTKRAHPKVLPPHGHHPPGPHHPKSSSAPILNNASRVQGSHNSIGPMDDLMEMDFSRSGSEVSTGYMEMRPGSKTTNHNQSRGGGYVEMRPGSYGSGADSGGRVPDTSPYVDMTSGSSPARQNDYMDMDPRKNLNNNNNFEYTDMDLPWHNRVNNRVVTTQPQQQTSNYHVGNQAMIIDYRSDGGIKPVATTTASGNDGYVRMSVRHDRRDSGEVDNDDYTNMTVGAKAKKRERRTNTTRSQPIAIQNAQPVQKQATSASPPVAFSSSSMWGRKFSTGTPPKMNLPLSGSSPFSSLGRNGKSSSRKNSRRNSKDSCSSSSVTTPSSSSTIFPLSLNSPCSPVKPEATSTVIKVPASVLNAVYKKSQKNSSDYVMMEPEVSAGGSDYVNFGPGRGETSGLVDRVASLGLGLEEAGFRPIDENREDSFDSGETGGAYEVLRQRPSSQTSRPSSTSSELCSSSSTIVGSRPESVNSDRVRPASVTSGGEVVLHYASLDLDDGNRSPRTVKAAADLTYADIDFVKSETLMLKQNNMAAVNTGGAVNKVKH